MSRVCVCMDGHFASTDTRSCCLFSPHDTTRVIRLPRNLQMLANGLQAKQSNILADMLWRRQASDFQKSGVTALLLDTCPDRSTKSRQLSPSTHDKVILKPRAGKHNAYGRQLLKTLL